MLDQFPFLRAVIRFAALGAVDGLIFNGAAFLIDQVWNSWDQDVPDEIAKRNELEQIVSSPFLAVRDAVREEFQQKSPLLPAEQAEVAIQYISHIPAILRTRFRRPTDITGRTVPANLPLRRAEDLRALLPDRPPRFHAGQQPIPGVDLELVELLGVGGFGEVWKARNPHLDGLPPVTLKFCLESGANLGFLRHEAAILNQVIRQGRHEGIVPLRQTYLSADPPCLEYEYIDGGDLGGLIHEWHRSGSPPSAVSATQVLLRLAEIVQFAHGLTPPIVHRDLKPANVLVRAKPDGGYSFHVTDFGIGGIAVRQAIEQTRQATWREMVVSTGLRGSCTPLYASPQQMKGESASPKDDVFSLGVIWFQSITGAMSDGVSTEWREEMEERGLPAGLIAVMAGCIAHKSEKRWGDAGSLVEEIRKVLPVEVSASRKEPISPHSGFPADMRSRVELSPSEEVRVTRSVSESGSIASTPSSDGVDLDKRMEQRLLLRWGVEVWSLRDLVEACEDYPIDSISQLRTGCISAWLQRVHLDSIADELSKVMKNEQSDPELLQHFLGLCGRRGKEIAARMQGKVKPDKPAPLTVPATTGSAAPCPRCGKSSLTGEGNCSACGLDLKPSTGPERSDCPNCGKSTQWPERKCGWCGQQWGQPLPFITSKSIAKAKQTVGQIVMSLIWLAFIAAVVWRYLGVVGIYILAGIIILCIIAWFDQSDPKKGGT